MTDMAQGMSQSPDTSNSTPVSTQGSNTHTPTSEPREERTFRQSEVTDIVKRERQEAIDRYRRLQVEQPEYVSQKYGDNHSASKNTGFDENHYRKIAAEEAQRLRDQWMQDARSRQEQEHARNIVSSFNQKMSSGREKYQDFDQVTGDIEYAAFPNVVQLLANYVDNSGDVLYSLGQDLTKMEILESLATRSPQTAIKQVQRLAKSLSDNEAAKNVRIPNEPLSQLRPSNTGVDNGAMSVNDYRKKYKV